MKKVTITGRNGFIGGALAKKLEADGVVVYPYLRNDVDCVFLFGSPSSNIIFNADLSGCIQETLTSFLHTIEFCKQNNIKLIYPSSATVYQKSNNYSHTKAALEEIQLAYDTDVLGLRIAAGYGPGEGHKKEYASIIYQFCQQMKKNEKPIVFGDGEQTRDFVFIDDIVNTILKNMDKKGIMDIRTGKETSMNQIVKIVNDVLGTNIVPIYVKKPRHYVTSTFGGSPIDNPIDVEEGIRRILEK